MTDSERLEFYIHEVAEETDRLLMSDTDPDTDKPRKSPVWFWENDSTNAEYATFRDARWMPR